jgi:hypothetical protein
LQQTAAIGALSPYLPAACATRPVQICFTNRIVVHDCPAGVVAAPYQAPSFATSPEKTRRVE